MYNEHIQTEYDFFNDSEFRCNKFSNPVKVEKKIIFY